MFNQQLYIFHRKYEDFFLSMFQNINDDKNDFNTLFMNKDFLSKEKIIQLKNLKFIYSLFINKEKQKFEHVLTGKKILNEMNKEDCIKINKKNFNSILNDFISDKYKNVNIISEQEEGLLLYLMFPEKINYVFIIKPKGLLNSFLMNENQNINIQKIYENIINNYVDFSKIINFNIHQELFTENGLILINDTQSHLTIKEIKQLLKQYENENIYLINQKFTFIKDYHFYLVHKKLNTFDTNLYYYLDTYIIYTSKNNNELHQQTLNYLKKDLEKISEILLQHHNYLEYNLKKLDKETFVYESIIDIGSDIEDLMIIKIDGFYIPLNIIINNLEEIENFFLELEDQTNIICVLDINEIVSNKMDNENSIFTTMDYEKINTKFYNIYEDKFLIKKTEVYKILYQLMNKFNLDKEIFDQLVHLTSHEVEKDNKIINQMIYEDSLIQFNKKREELSNKLDNLNSI